VASEFPEHFKVTALAAGRRVERLAEQAREFGVSLVSVERKEDAARVRELIPGVEIRWGKEGLLEIALSQRVDMVVAALVGAAGLPSTLSALEAGIDVALANKETLVMAGELMCAAAKKSGASILPVDSEHSAVFQALAGHDAAAVKRIILTASGGPFFGRSKESLKEVTPEEALAHPNWDMGRKISIDSATMMNKGLEVIEARWLFGLDAHSIAVTVHPQSVVHSMVEFADGSIIAHMGVADMRGPIAYALGYPDRLPLSGMALDLGRMGALTFAEPDLDTFPALGLAYDAIKEGGTMPALLSGANEVAVESFLAGKIGFADISEVVSRAMSGYIPVKVDSLEAVLEADRVSRVRAGEAVKNINS